MNVLSVNVGKPETFNLNGKTKISSINKQPVEGPIEFKDGNLIGDKQYNTNVHGGKYKAIYLYPSEHYNYWQEQFPDKRLNCGSFGENITTVGMLESNVCLGNIYKLGSIEVAISQPRFPCLNLNFKFQTEKMVEKFVKARKNGFYVQVLKPGVVETNSKIELLREDPNPITVSEFVEKYYTDRKNSAFYEKLILNKYVSENMKAEFNKI